MTAETDNTAPENLSEGSLEERVADITKSLAEQIVSTCRAEAEAAVQAATSQARKETLETVSNSFAEVASRIRKEDSVTGIATALVEGAGRFSGRAALFIHRGNQLLGFRVAGEPDAEKQSAFQRLSIDVQSASSAAHAIESLDSVVSQGTAGELSQSVVELFELSEEDRVHLMPVALRDRVLALVYCDNRGPDGESAVLEPAIKTLISLAEAWIEAVGTRRKQAAA